MSIVNTMSQGRNPNRSRSIAQWHQWALAVALWILPTSTAYAFQTLLAAGDERDLWVLKVNTDGNTGFTLLYRDYRDTANTLRRVTTLQGQVAANGLACAQGQLWLVYKSTSSQPNLTVQSIRVLPESDLPPQRQGFGSPQFQPSLPHGIDLQSLAANKHGPWALVRVKDQKALQQIDASLDLNAKELHDTSPASKTPSTQTLLEPDPQRPIRQTRLLQLVRNQWVKVPLPDDWLKDVKSKLITRRQDDLYPLLVSIVPTENQISVRLYQYDGQIWTHQPFHLQAQVNNQPPNASHQAASKTTALALATGITAVDGQVIVGLPKASHKKLEWEFSVLRSTTATTLGTLSMDYQPSWPWAIVPHGHAAAILVNAGQGRLTWSRIGLQGDTTPSTDFSPSIVEPSSDTADTLVLTTVWVASFLIMLIFWQREPTKNRLELPPNISVAPLIQRALAGAIDFVPGVVVAAMIFRIVPQDLIDHWPGYSGGWHQMLPGTVAIAVFALHTMLAELFTGKTLGKAILGLRVCTLNGSPPNVWQVITRNLMKIFELIAWQLLIMPLIAPYHQRLGDLAARTVVVDSPNPLTQKADGPTKKIDNNDNAS